MNSIEMLSRAADGHRRISVITPEGRLTGYLAGIDEGHIVLYAQYRVPDRDEVKVVWSITIVPRTMVMVVEDQTLSSEAADVQEVYMGVAGRFLTGVQSYMEQKRNESLRHLGTLMNKNERREEPE